MSQLEDGEPQFRRIFPLLPHLPAKVSSLNAERLLTLGGTNRPSCPKTDTQPRT